MIDSDTLLSSFLAHEPTVRLTAFFGIFSIMAVCELLAPRRVSTVSKSLRWFSNLSLVGLNTVVARLVLPMAPVAFAGLCAANGWGMLNLIDGPLWIEVLGTVVLLDFAIWLQHVMVHAILLLWRLHRVHHSVLPFETNANFGFNLSVWDRLFATYVAQPQGGHEAMIIGLDVFRDPVEERLDNLITQPFRTDQGLAGYTLTDRDWPHGKDTP
jgi:sterol desaturase/sphingolipid hydroxylase (fatty acid hydroxylase superfamily)